MGVHRSSLTAAGHFGLAGANHHRGGVGVPVDIDAIVARPQQHDGSVGRVHLKGFVAIQVDEMHIDGALGHAELRHAIVQVQEGKCGLIGKMDGAGADVHIGPRIPLRP